MHAAPGDDLPRWSLPSWDRWHDALSGPARAALEDVLAAGLPLRRWFGSKTRRIRAVRLLDSFPVSHAVQLALFEVQFADGPSEIYQLPLAFAELDRAMDVLANAPSSVWAHVHRDDKAGPAVVYDALVDDTFGDALLSIFDERGTLAGDTGQLIADTSPVYLELRGANDKRLPTRLLQAEQSNSSIVFGNRLILKLFRRLEMGTNPDLELIAHLTRQGFAHVPPLAGSIAFLRDGQHPWALAVLQRFVPNQGDAWQWFLSRLEPFLAQAAEGGPPPKAFLPSTKKSLAAAAQQQVPAIVATALELFLPDAQRLGQRTAEMHLALAAGEETAIMPEPFESDDRRRMADGANAMVKQAFELLRLHAPRLEGDVRRRADDVLARRAQATRLIERFAEQPLDVQQIRCHGDYHLGQVLVAGGDYQIIDFEGEPARSLAERRRKQLALRDVAGMIRSFHYAACAAAMQAKQSRPSADQAAIDAWAAGWYHGTACAFLNTYRTIAGTPLCLPHAPDQFALALDVCLLDKAMYELRYELNNRPDWVYLPLAALDELLT